MNILTPRNYAPASVSRYLLPSETLVIAVRQHPVVLAKHFFITLGVLIAEVIISSQVSTQSAAQVAIWLPGIAAIVWLAIAAANWWVDWFTVSQKRFILTTGIITKKVAMMPLTRVTDMSYQRSAMGRILGYGEFILESAGQDQALRSVPYLPYPEQMYRRVGTWIFPERFEGDDDAKAPQFQLRIDYTDGRDILRKALGPCTRLGFVIKGFSAPEDTETTDHRYVSAVVDVQGEGSQDALIATLADIDGIVGVRITPAGTVSATANVDEGDHPEEPEEPDTAS